MPTAQWGTIEAFPDPVCVLDRQGRIQHINVPFLLLPGFSTRDPKSLLNEPIWSALAHDQAGRDAVAGLWAETRQRGSASTTLSLNDEHSQATIVRLDARQIDADHLLVTLRPQAPPERPAEEYRDLVIRSEALMFAHALDGTLRLVSPAMGRSLGYAAEAMIGRDFGDYVAAEDRERWAQARETLRESGSTRAVLRILSSSGEERVWDYSAWLPNQDAAGSVAYANAGDISERALMEEALTASEERYRRSLDRASDAIWLLGSGGECFYVNNAACTLLGRERQELLDRPLTDFMVESDRGEARAQIAKMLAGGEFRSLTQMQQPDGTTVPIELKGVALGDGTFQAIGRDMSEWVEAQEAIRASEERYRSVVETPTRGMLVTDRQGVIRFHNQAAVQLLADGAPVADRSLAGLLLEAERPAVEEALERVTSAGVASVEARTDRDAKGARLLQLRLTYLSASEEVLVEALDITEQRALEERVRHAQQMDSLGDLAAGISHDFNNLLTVIQANLSEAARDVEGETARLLQTAGAATRSAAELSQQLLAIGRSSDATRQPVCLRAHVEELYGLLRRAVDPNIEFVASVPEDLYVLGSPTQLQHVLMNLALNAIEAMPDGGRVEIVGRRLEPDAPPFDMPRREHGYGAITVKDNGQGMDEETAARAFEPYFSTKGESGTGLGLAMVYGIVREHGGAISLSTTPGEGTTFEILLPATPAPTASEQDAGDEGETARRPAEGGSDARGAARVLVVDDRPELRAVCASILQSEGYQVELAGDGREAIAKVQGRGRRPDVVLLDSSMPGMSGEETFEELRRMLPSLKVVFMSGYRADSFEGLAADSGWTFLAKPFQRDELLNAVAALLAPVTTP